MEKVCIRFRLAAVFLIFAVIFGICTPRAAARAEFRDDSDRSAIAVLFACDGYARSHAFNTRFTGRVEAHVFGVPYSQSIVGGRRVGNGVYEDSAESHSAFVSAAIKKRKTEKGFEVSRGKFKRGEFVYEAPEVLDYGAFVAAYGKPAVSLCRHELAVISAECLSPCKYRYVLDCNKAVIYSGNEVETALGARPRYESLEILLTVNGQAPAVVVVKEVFSVDKFGGVKCRAEYTEEFAF